MKLGCLLASKHLSHTPDCLPAAGNNKEYFGYFGTIPDPVLEGKCHKECILGQL